MKALSVVWVVCVLVGPCFAELAGNVVLIESSLEYQEVEDGSLALTGEVANFSDVPVCFVRVTVSIYDVSMNKLGDGWTYILGEYAVPKGGTTYSLSGLGPHRSALFRVLLPEVEYSDARYYEAALSWMEADTVTLGKPASWGKVKAMFR